MMLLFHRHGAYVLDVQYARIIVKTIGVRLIVITNSYWNGHKKQKGH